MTRQFVRTSQFKRDYRKRVLSPKIELAVTDVLGRLLSGAPFGPHHRDHLLQGAWSGVRDCRLFIKDWGHGALDEPPCP
ncbi:MAG: type II toxin-antitoxin system YafQ family toxin, partial [Lacunisphaera sp.]|nr:type II toxin-antitoxin system YafQ family toxin [Lacunisphaera sp.]